jgi:hypothetical protein
MVEQEEEMHIAALIIDGAIYTVELATDSQFELLQQQAKEETDGNVHWVWFDPVVNPELIHPAVDFNTVLQAADSHFKAHADRMEELCGDVSTE